MRLIDFKLTDPELGNISMLRNDSGSISYITISKTDCNLSSYGSSLGSLTNLLIEIEGLGEINVSKVTNYNSYYFLEIEPFDFSGSLNEDACNPVTLTPFNEATNIDFRNSVFYPVYNNVPETLTVEAFKNLFDGKTEIRRGKNIYDVDRKNDAIVPTNITNLLEDTANLAEFPESNYSALANITGRYLGSKTSVEDYGTNPSLGLIQVDLSIFNTTISDSAICSQSLSDLVITEASFNSTYNTKPNPNLIPTASIGGIDGFINGTPVPNSSPASITATQTEMEFTIPDTNVYKLKPGAIVQLTNNTKVDYVEVTKVETIGPQTGWNRTIFKVTVTRGIDGTSVAMDGVFTATGSGQYEIISIRFIDSDTLYTYEGSKPITVSNKKVYIPSSGEIYKVGPKGRILYGTSTCN